MINNCDIAHYITFDLEKVGRMQAEGVLEITNKGRFYYLGGSPTDNNARFFRKGAMDTLQPYIERRRYRIDRRTIDKRLASQCGIAD